MKSSTPFLIEKIIIPGMGDINLVSGDNLGSPGNFKPNSFVFGGFNGAQFKKESQNNFNANQMLPLKNLG
jgi:hypothetical protein